VSRSGHATRISIVHDASGQPVAVWVETAPDGGSDVALRRWDGAQWSPWGPFSSVGQAAGSVNARFPSVAAAGEDVFVAWQQDAPDGTSIRLARWNDSEFEICGGTDTMPAPQSSWPIVAANASGTFALAWVEDTDAGFELYLQGGRVLGADGG